MNHEISSPTKLEMRIVFELALHGAKTQAMVEMLQQVILWYELAWQQEDRKLVEAEQAGQANGHIKIPEI